MSQDTQPSDRPRRPQYQGNHQGPPTPRPAPEANNPSMDLGVTIMVAGTNKSREFTVREVFASGKAKPTKAGNHPGISDVMSYLEYCRASSLDPLGPDAHLVGRDSNSGPTFVSQSSFSSMIRIAELSGKYSGLEFGVICQTAKGEFIDREGEFAYPTDTIVGAWARVYRSDWEGRPLGNRVPLSKYTSGFGLWISNPGLMITKVAIASCLRKAFPTVASMYCEEEMEMVGVDRTPKEPQAPKRANPALAHLTGAPAADAKQEEESSPI